MPSLIWKPVHGALELVAIWPGPDGPSTSRRKAYPFKQDRLVTPPPAREPSPLPEPVLGQKVAPRQ